MTLEEAVKIKESLEELSADVETFNWGPSLEFARQRQAEAIRIIKQEIAYINRDTRRPKACTHAPAQMTTQWDHGIEIGNPFCIKCGGSIGKEIDHE